MRRLFKQFSFPGGVPSHVAAEVPGSIHEGGELGYALSHAFGAAFDNPDLVAACVIGDGEAETGPLAASWHSNKFLDPVRDGAVLPILHLNGYKISNPSVLARIEPEELESLLVGYGWKPYFVEGSDPAVIHRQMAETLDTALDEIAEIQAEARASGQRAPPALADDRAAHAEGLDRAEGGRRPQDRGPLALAPGAAVRAREPARPPRAARGVDAQLPARGAVRRRRPARARAARARPRGRAAHGREPARQRRHAAAQPADARLPRLRGRRPGAGRVDRGGHEGARRLPQRRHAAQPRGGQLPPVRAGRERVQPAAGGLRDDRQDVARARAPRRRGPRGRRAGDGDPLRAHLPGLARGLPADRPPRAVLLLRGVHPHRRLDVQPAREVAEDHARAGLAGADRVAELPPDLARLAPGPQRLQPPGPGLHRPRRQQEGRHRARLAAAGRQHAAGRRRPVPAQPRPRQRDRGGQAAGAAVPRHERRDPAHAPRASGSGTGRATTRTTSPTW